MRESLDHPVILRMEQGCCRDQDPNRRTDSRPDGGGKLSHSLSEVRTTGHQTSKPKLREKLEHRIQLRWKPTEPPLANKLSCRSLSKDKKILDWRVEGP